VCVGAVLGMQLALPHVYRRNATWDSRLRDLLIARWDLSATQVDSSDVLTRSGTLHRVLSYVGVGQWFFLSTICKGWLKAYMQLHGVNVETPKQSLSSGQVHVRYCSFNSTLYSAIFASASRVELVHAEANLRLSKRSNWKLQRIAGTVADISTLVAAHDLGLRYSDDLTLGAAASGSVSKVAWLHTVRGRPLPVNISHFAATSNNLQLLILLKEMQAVFDEHTLAAASGHMKAVEYLCDQGCPLGTTATDAAARRGDMAMLKYLRNRGCPWRTLGIDRCVAESGDIEMMRWIQEHGCDVTIAIPRVAARKGDLNMLAFLMSEQCEFDTSICTTATLHGHLPVLKWAVEHGLPIDYDDILQTAASNGCASILQFAVEQFQQLSSDQQTELLNFAGVSGEIESASWLREHGAAWPAILKHENRCWKTSTMLWAKQQGCTSPKWCNYKQCSLPNDSGQMRHYYRA
jgi:hypothetical protein